uniref:MULE transposase domain-containing protein n=1 Tax=Rhizophagus irregularis (strain DAOM 181602 / DAOM 197198 / MUCL 43194) TaxID=747089 RepID=U9TXH1_RHIID
MTRALYANRISWTKVFASFQFNAGIQNTQSVESFNSIIKKSLNNASSLCDIEEAIDKRHEEEIKYCKLTDIKSLYTTIGFPHLSSQFFSSIDRQFQISQAFTYEGQLTSYLSEDASMYLCRDNHKRDNEILIKLDEALEKLPVFTAIEPPTNNTTLPHEVNFTLQGLRHIQQSGYKENVQQIVPQRNRFGVAFSTAKIAINVALETKSDNELVQLLKDFISSKKNCNGGVRNNENNQDNNEIVPLQQCLIDEVTDPHVIKIRGAPYIK